MGRVFKTRSFAKAAHKAGIGDDVLRRAVRDADLGIIAAQLGGNVVKLRIARKGEGKSGGFRTILAYKTNDRAFFVYLFAKIEAENVSESDLAKLKLYAKSLLALTSSELDFEARLGNLEEI